MVWYEIAIEQAWADTLWRWAVLLGLLAASAVVVWACYRLVRRGAS